MSKATKKTKEPHPNSCFYCRNLKEDRESSEGYTLYSYLYCSKNEVYENLKSFPFKTDRPCFEIDYWSAIVRDEELKALFEEELRLNNYSSERNSYKLFDEKYVLNKEQNVQASVATMPNSSTEPDNQIN